MGNLIPRPGVEVVQEIRTPSTTFFTPTMPPCIMGPAYEVIELYVNGVLNTSKSRYQDSNGDSYQNFQTMTIDQDEFPGGHVTAATSGETNVAAGLVDMLENEIRAFLLYSSQYPRELAEYDASALTRIMRGFMVAHNVATRAYVKGTVALSAASYNLEGLTLTVCVDMADGTYPDYVPSTADLLDTTITFTAGSVSSGGVSGLLTPAEIVTQINSAIPGLAHLHATDYKLVLASPSYGAKSRVIVRYGSANSTLGFQGSTAGDVYSLGAGFRGKDDNDNDFTTPYIELYRGAIRISGTIECGYLTQSTSGAYTYTSSGHPISNVDFTALNGLALRAGDELWADGVVAGHLFAVQSSQMTLGAAVTAVATPTSKLEINIPTAGSPWSPRYVYFVARNLSYPAPASSTQAYFSGTNATDNPWRDPKPAQVTAATAPTSFDFSTGKTIKYTVVKNGVAIAERTHLISGDCTNIAGLVSCLNSGAGGASGICSPTLASYDDIYAVADGTKLSLRTGTVTGPVPRTGSDETLTIGNGTAWAQIDDSAGTPNIVYGQTYQGLDTFHPKKHLSYLTNSWARGGGSYYALYNAEEAGADFATAPVNKEFRLLAITDNQEMVNYRLKANGDFASAGPAGYDTNMIASYSYARELNGLSHTSAGTIVIVDIDGDTSLAGRRFIQEPGLVKWHFEGADEYMKLSHHTITLTYTGGNGNALHPGDAVNQLISLAQGTVVYDTNAAAGQPGTICIAVTANTFNLVNEIDGPGGETRTGPFVQVLWTAGDSVLQATTLATGTVISDAGTLGGVCVTIIRPTSGTFSALQNISNATTAVATTYGQPFTGAARLALAAAQEGRSNDIAVARTTIAPPGGDLLTDSIGFTHLQDVRGVGIRPGSMFYFELDDNPAQVAVSIPQQHIQWDTLTGLDVIFLDDIVDDINAAAKQTVASIDTTLGTGRYRLKLNSTLYGLPSQLKVDPQGQGSGNAGYIELIDPAGITVPEMGLTFDEATATTQTASGFATHSGRGAFIRGVGRPLPDFAVIASDPAQVFVNSQVIRNMSTGEPLSDAVGDLYLTYRALRQDICAEQGENGFELLELTIDDVEEYLEPLNDKNPLGLAARLAISNLSNIPVYAIGVGEISADEPDGTLESWAALLEFLESKRVYALAPLTNDTRIHDMVKTHVVGMSEPTSKGERIAFVASEYPTREISTLIGSGLDANSMPMSTQILLDNSIIAALLAAGVSDVGNITVAEDVYLELADTPYRWNIQSATPVSGGCYLTVRLSFSATENTDSFYTTSSLPGSIVNLDWAVYKRGAVISTNDELVDAIVAQAEHFNHRRITHVVAKEAAVNLTGTEDLVDNFYLCAAWAALAAQQMPQQGFTNYSVSGFTRVYGTNDTFSPAQLDEIAGGGNFIVTQYQPGGPIQCRHQLTTNVSSVETQELSITRQLDYTSYFLRDGTRDLIGTYNITPSFMDMLSTLLQGMCRQLQAWGVVNSATLNNLVQDTSDPTALLVEIVIDPAYPCNYIKITLVI